MGFMQAMPANKANVFRVVAVPGYHKDTLDFRRILAAFTSHHMLDIHTQGRKTPITKT